MQRLLAIAKLTVKAAFRFKLVVVLAILLVGAVVGLPFIIKDDGTARGFTQILLTYTLIAITTLLGFATLWLACGTLARDIEECQIQTVAVKPVARWEIWIGKWLGIMFLNAILLAPASGAVFFLLKWRATRLPPAQYAILTNEVLVARSSARPPLPDINADVQRLLQERLKDPTISAMDRTFVRKQIEEQLKAAYQLVPPSYRRRWEIPLGFAKNFLQDQPLYLRVKFYAAAPPGTAATPQTYDTGWAIGPPETAEVRRMQTSLAAETFHELQVPPNLFDSRGILTVELYNLSDTGLLFPMDEAIEVLYRQGGFGLNFVRGVGIIYCWLGLLAALGLAAASLLSFPVAAFFSLGILLVGLSKKTLTSVVEDGTILGVNHETGLADPHLIDKVAVPALDLLLRVIKLVLGFSPVDALSTGRTISWTVLGLAALQVGLLVGGIISLIGIIIFSRRELGLPQGTV